MSRTDPRTLNPKMHAKYLDALWTAIASLESKKEAQSFLEGFLSKTESIMLGKRILIAQALNAGVSYSTICQKYTAGPDTVAKVHEWLTSKFGGSYGSIEELERVLTTRYEKITIKNTRGKYARPYSEEWMRKHYPFHYILYDLLVGKKEDQGNK